MNNRSRVLTFLPVIMMAVIVIYAISNSSTVVDKLQIRNTSYLHRQSDVYNSFDAIKESPLIGYGIGTNTYYEMVSKYNLAVNSVGFFASSMNMGVIYASIFTFLLFAEGYKQYKNVFIPFVVVIAISAVTEDFYRYSIYFAMLFGFAPEANYGKNQLTTHARL